MWRGLVVMGLLLGGCDQLFGLDRDPSHDAGVSPSCTVVDEFDTTLALGTMWSLDNGFTGVEITEAGGKLVMKPRSMLPGYNGIHTVLQHDVTGMIAHVELAQVLSPGTTEVDFVVGHDFRAQPDDNYYLTYVSHGDLQFRVKQGASDEVGLPFSPTEHRFARMRFEAGMVFFETSADDATWTVRYQHAATVPTASLDLELRAGTYGNGVQTPGEAHFDHLDLCPIP